VDFCVIFVRVLGVDLACQGRPEAAGQRTAHLLCAPQIEINEAT